MTAKGYCTIGEVTAITGDLTAAQMARAQDLIAAAETYLDGEMGRAWLVGTQTQEAHFYPATFLHLDYWPIGSVTAVYGRTSLGETEETLTADDDYEVQNLAAGIIRLTSPGSWDRVRVTYVPVDTVPEDVRLAAAELVASWLQPSLQPGSFGIDSYSLPDLTVKFSRSHYQAAAPPLAQRVIDRYRVPVHA